MSCWANAASDRILASGEELTGRVAFTDHERQTLLAGGLLKYLRKST